MQEKIEKSLLSTSERNEMFSCEKKLNEKLLKTTTGAIL